MIKTQNHPLQKIHQFFCVTHHFLVFEEQLIHTEQIELSRVMTNVNNSISLIYMTLCIQFGYLVLFGAFFPVASFICFLFNLAIIGFMVLAFSTHVRRSLSSNMQCIGIWNRVINFLGYLAPFYNIALIMLPGVGSQTNRNSLINYWLNVVFGCAIVIFIKYLLEITLPKESKWLKRERVIEEKLQRLEKQSREEEMMISQYDY